MTKSVCIIGSNRGIGLALVEEYLSHEWTVYAVCRTPSASLTAIATENANLHIVSDIDVTKASDIENLCTELSTTCTEVIHNAGILRGDTVETATDADILEQFTVNALAPLNTLRALKSLLPNLSKVGIVTSRMGSIGDCSRHGMLGYRISKTAVNMVGKNLANAWASPHFMLLLLHPGYVRTDMTGGNGLINPDESARGLFTLMRDKGPKDSGTFWHTDGSPLPW